MSDHAPNHQSQDNRDPAEIERDLDRTRAEMSSTIDAIQQKLTPGQMMDQAVAYARTSLPADFGSNLGNAIRDNPIPTALIGVGIAWLMAAGQHADGQARLRRQSARSVRIYTGPGTVDDYDAYDTSYSSDTYSSDSEGKMHRAASAMSEKGREMKDRASETGRSIMDKASELGHRISDSASSMTGRARDMTNSARERIQGTSGSARARASELSHRATELSHRASELSHRSQEQYYRAKDGFSRMLEEQPLMVGMLGFAVGTLLGAALPSTRREDQMMGHTRDDLMERAKRTASEQAERVKESAKHVAQVAKEDAMHVAQVAKEEAKGVASDASASLKDKEDGHAKSTSASSTTGGTKTEGTPGQHGYH
jgi:hypothetical protein